MLTIEEIINKLTVNQTRATRICIKLQQGNHIQTLIDLEKLNIIGEDLEKLYEICDILPHIECLVHTVKYLSANQIDKVTIIDNIRSNNPVPFITCFPSETDDIKKLYKQFTTKFYSNFRASRENLKKR